MASTYPLPTKADRQIAKLELAQAKRQLVGTPGYRSLRYYDANLLPARYQENDTVFTPHPGGLQQGRPWKTTPNILAGLWRSTYAGYYDGDPTWFDAHTPIESISVDNFNLYDGDIFSSQWLGYFQAPHTATYTFYRSSDDASGMWLGENAITGYTDLNQFEGTIGLEEGQLVPIRLQYGNAGGPKSLNFSWSDDFGPDIPAPVTQDLILFFDSERTACYSGTGTTIYNLVDNTPSTLFGDVTYDNGVLRISNTDTSHPTNRISGIQCQTVTGFKTISLWYKQKTSSAGYYSYIVDARGGMPGGWIYDTPGSDWFGSDWGAGTMFIDGGASQSPTYTQQLNVWRNVTFVTNGTAFTDDIALFSRNNHIEGLDVEFGACMIYSRAITEAENKHNYDQFKTRYQLSTYESVDPTGQTITVTKKYPFIIYVKSSSYEVTPFVEGELGFGNVVTTFSLRGHTVLALTPTGTVIDNSNFDTWEGPGIDNLNTALLGYPSGTIVAMGTYDACSLNAAVRSTLNTYYGGTLTNTWGNAFPRTSHIFIGQKI